MRSTVKNGPPRVEGSVVAVEVNELPGRDLPLPQTLSQGRRLIEGEKNGQMGAEGGEVRGENNTRGSTRNN